MNPKTPSVFSFPFGGNLWTGYSEKMIEAITRSQRGDFLRYSEHEVECLRCGNGVIGSMVMLLPLFLIAWDSEELVWKPYWTRAKHVITRLYCSNCDTPPCLDAQCVIRVVDRLPGWQRVSESVWVDRY